MIPGPVRLFGRAFRLSRGSPAGPSSQARFRCGIRGLVRRAGSAAGYDLGMGSSGFRHLRNPVKLLRDRQISAAGPIWMVASTYLVLSLICPPILAEGTALRLPRLEHLSVEQGLAHNTVRAVHQDRFGFIWLASESYVQRFDGMELRPFKHNPEDAHSLSESQVMGIFEDAQQRMWMSTRSEGINLWLPEQERFRRYLPDAEDSESLIPGMVLALDDDPDGLLWVGSSNGLSRLDPDTGRVRRFVHDAERPPGSERPGSLGNNAVLSVLVDARGDLWVGHLAGLDRLPRASFDQGDKGFLAYRHDPEDVHSLSSDQHGALFEDSQGILWVSTWDGMLHRYDPEKDHFDRFDPRSSDPRPGSSGRPGIQVIEEDENGDLWLGTVGRGVIFFDRRAETFSWWLREPGDPHGLSSERINDIEVDRSGVLWLATENGLDRLDPRRGRFEVWRQGDGDRAALLEPTVSALAEDAQGRLWVGTQEGTLSVFDGDRRLQTWRDGGPGHPRGMVRSIHQDADGRVWVGTKRGVWWLESEGAGGLFRSRAILEGRGAPQVNALVSAFGAIWLGTNQGLQRLDPGDFSLREARPLETGPRASQAKVIYGLSAHVPLADRPAGLWLVTESGFFHFDPGTFHFEEIGEAPAAEVVVGSAPEGPSSLNLVSIHTDSQGVIWLGSYGGGLSRWDPQSDSWRHFGEKDGLPSDKVVGIMGGSEGDLWLATNGGLSRFDPKEKQFRSFDVSDGLHGNVTLIGTVLHRADGRMVIGGPGGMTTFDPSALTDDPVPPEVVLTELSISDETVALGSESPLEKSILVTDHVTLTHRDRTFAVELAALHFAAAERNRYAYQLEGYDEGWIYTDARRRRARYTNLDAGDYTFRVKASNKDGIWSPETRDLSIRILPPPWKTWWAYLLYGIAVVGSVLAYVGRQKAKLARERKINDQLRQVDRLKDELLSNTSHELRTPLQGITGLAESLLDGASGPLTQQAREDLSLLLASGRRLGVLVDDLLDFAKLDHRELSLNRKSVDVHAVAQVVTTLSLPLVDDARVELINEVPMDLPAVDADEHRLVQILHNLVGNAVKFTREGTVRITAAVDESNPGMLRIEVADTGIGISEAQQMAIFEPFHQIDGATDRSYGGTGLGLAVSRQLVELHGGSLQVSSELQLGSTFYFTLPLSDQPAERTALLSPELEVPSLRPMGSDRAGRRLSAREAFEGSGGGESARSLSVKAPKGAGAFLEVPAIEGRILVVDDEAVNRRVLSNFLTAEGYTVEAAPGGAEALDVLEQRETDLVLLDIMMPRVSGYDVCREARRYFAFEELPIIFLSAKIQPADVVMGLAQGANDFLLKPISKAELLARIRPHFAMLEIYRHLEHLVEEKVSQVKVLGGLLPICSTCKRIRDDAGYWAELETFIAERSEAQFTHGVCPSCARRHFSELQVETPLI